MLSNNGLIYEKEAKKISIILDQGMTEPIYSQCTLSLLCCFQEIEKGCIGNEWVKNGYWRIPLVTSRIIKSLIIAG